MTYTQSAGNHSEKFQKRGDIPKPTFRIPKPQALPLKLMRNYTELTNRICNESLLHRLYSKEARKGETGFKTQKRVIRRPPREFLLQNNLDSRFYSSSHRRGCNLTQQQRKSGNCQNWGKISTLTVTEQDPVEAPRERPPPTPSPPPPPASGLQKNFGLLRPCLSSKKGHLIR